MQKQKGVVLFFAIIVLLLLTIIGVSLATNSSMSLMMAGSGTERLEALLTAQGKLKNGVEAIRMGNEVAEDIIIRNDRLTCPRVGNANSNNQGAVVNKFICREIGATETYGRNDAGQVTVVVGVNNIIDEVEGN
ncbi:pilus assembly protein PilX [Shewanella sp. OPT22]|nr:pilus assembly protein PilX [Shewanella sp. OPT22]